MRYVDDTFAIWAHEMNKLNEFLLFINSFHSNIKFTMEIKKEGLLPFLDVHIYRKNDGYSGRKV